MMQSIFAANRTSLVTGASAGIGLELTRALAPRLDSLIVVARRSEHLSTQRLRLLSRVQIFLILKRFKVSCNDWKPMV